ncbi:hypothetical protein AGMMS50268_21330 [Spirochaetia bacterium]|nr:hypothetical protein AGMMS50268_21330 [Spirochaetia bacterium]
MGRELLQYYDGLTWDQILAAVRNYGLVNNVPGSWWTSKPNILYWSKNQLTNFLPENFRLEYYFNKRDIREDDSEADAELERRRRLEAEVLGGGHGTE